MVFEGAANWKGGTECDLTIKGNTIATISPPPEFDGKVAHSLPGEIFATSLVSCMNIIFLLVASNCKLWLCNLDTKAAVTMSFEGLEKIVLKHIHVIMDIGLQTDNERE